MITTTTQPGWWTLFEDNSGGFSMIRLCLLIIVLAIMLNWSYGNYQKKEIQPLPEGSIALICGFAGAKTVQRFGEKSVEVTPTVTPTVPPVS